ncbi:MAG: hypothetical protein ACRC0V_06615 [Fusobacteriaceae bacterium]
MKIEDFLMEEIGILKNYKDYEITNGVFTEHIGLTTKGRGIRLHAPKLSELLANSGEEYLNIIEILTELEMYREVQSFPDLAGLKNGYGLTIAINVKKEDSTKFNYLVVLKGNCLRISFEHITKKKEIISCLESMGFLFKMKNNKKEIK